MPVYKNRSAKRNPWYIEFEAGKDPVTGQRRRYKKRGFGTKKEAELALAKWRYEVALMEEGKGLTSNGLAPKEVMAVSEAPITLITYAKQWLDYRHRLSDNTKELYHSILRMHIFPSLGTIPLQQLTAEHVQQFVQGLSAKGLSDSTIKRVFSLLHAILQAAVKTDRIPRNVAALVEKPTIRRRSFTVWSLELIRTFLSRLQEEGGRYAIVFALAILTGMRQGEILGLRWQDVDFDQRVIRMQQTLTHRGTTFQSGGKTAKSVRVIALTQETIRWLETHRQEQSKQQPQAELVISSTEGGPLTPRVLHRLWQQLLQKWQLPRITFHDLRHTHASILLQQGVHPKVVSERLGHSSVHMTLNTYSHLLPHLQHDMVEPLDQLLFVNEKNSPDSSRDCDMKRERETMNDLTCEEI